MKNATLVAIEKIRKIQLYDKDCSRPFGLVKLEDAERIIEQMEIDILNQLDLEEMWKSNIKEVKH